MSQGGSSQFNGAPQTASDYGTGNSGGVMRAYQGYGNPYGSGQAGGNMYPGGNMMYAKMMDGTQPPPSYQPPQMPQAQQPQLAPQQNYLQAQYQNYQIPQQQNMTQRGMGGGFQNRMMFNRGQMDPNYFRAPPVGNNPPPVGGNPPPVTPPPVTPTPVTPTPTPDPVTPPPSYTPPYTPGPNESPPVGGAWGQSGGLLSAQSAMFMGGANGPTSPPPNNDYSMGWNYAKKAWEPMK